MAERWKNKPGSLSRMNCSSFASYKNYVKLGFLASHSAFGPRQTQSALAPKRDLESHVPCFNDSLGLQRIFPACIFTWESSQCHDFPLFFINLGHSSNPFSLILVGTLRNALVPKLEFLTRQKMRWVPSLTKCN